MRKFATIDCETNPFEHGAIIEPFIWGFFDKEKHGYIYYFDTKEFIDFLKEYDGLVYAHNGGKFDFHFLLEGIEEQEEVLIINGRIASIKLGKCELRDSYLLFPVPLKQFKKDDIDYKLFKKETRNKYMPEIVKYLKGDCEYLYELLEIQFNLYGQKLTLASSAFAYWHKNFNDFKRMPKSNKYFFQNFKRYYYGGRVQCFEKGVINKEFKMVDINSAYPYAMQFEHPYGDEYKTYNKLPKENIEQCFIQFKGISKGILPFRDKNGLQFPTDNEIREYFATGWEFKLGIEKNLIEIKQIIKVTQFTNSINFKKYVDYFYNIKNNTDKKEKPAEYLLAKLYLNSLYGKFGQSSLKHRNYCIVEPQNSVGYLNENFDFEGNIGEMSLMSKIIDENKMKFYNVATACSVTGFVRAYLYRHILECENPIYCDTDSIACVDFKGKIGHELGAWGIDGEFTKGAIGGKKLYCFINEKNNLEKISSKGAKLTKKDIFAIAKGEEICYKQEAPSFHLTKGYDYLVRKIKMT